MANLRAGTLARKKNGRFPSTAVKRKPQDETSSDSLDDAKLSCQSESESKTALWPAIGEAFCRGVELGLLSVDS